MSEEFQKKISELNKKAEEAEVVRSIVEAREPHVERFREEMRLIRSQNRFTELFNRTVGARP